LEPKTRKQIRALDWDLEIGTINCYRTLEISHIKLELEVHIKLELECDASYILDLEIGTLNWGFQRHLFYWSSEL